MHHAEQHEDAADPHSQAFWDTRYASREQIWSGNPNAQLVAEVAALAPARALDVGTGEGADALWLAQRGWQVTAVDISAVALERAAARAAEHGDGVAGRIDWTHADIRMWAPPPAAFDLVTAQFLHPPPDVRPGVIGRLAAAVAPGGLFLYVGHDPADLALRKHRHADAMATAPEIARLLEPDAWEIEVAEARPREGTLPDGRRATLHDAVLRARRAGR